jgi:hypothetical protein
VALAATLPLAGGVCAPSPCDQPFSYGSGVWVACAAHLSRHMAAAHECALQRGHSQLCVLQGQQVGHVAALDAIVGAAPLLLEPAAPQGAGGQLNPANYNKTPGIHSPGTCGHGGTPAHMIMLVASVTMTGCQAPEHA